MSPRRIGVWLIGAHGHLATTLMVGAKAIVKGLCSKGGLVTELEEFSGLDLIGLEGLCFGGHDIRRGDIYANAWEICRRSGIFSPDSLPALEVKLKGIEEEIRPGISLNCGQAIEELANWLLLSEGLRVREIIALLASDLLSFKKRNGLDGGVVVNLASTEPLIKPTKGCFALKQFERILDADDTASITASTLYAYAAIAHGFAYINFTPSNGAFIPALVELAEERRVPIMGCDGKTGETLLKSVLAPMFRQRNLNILSWQGYNILGGGDGKVLSHLQNKEAKIRSKDRILPKILGYTPHSQVVIDYVPSLEGWKTAWDFIHFSGFMDTKMSLQFIWQGCDSILAAPLVLDMIRLADLAQRSDEGGLMRHLACFFKDPLGVEEHSFPQQFAMLIDYVRRHLARG